jgi:uncharacterized protein
MWVSEILPDVEDPSWHRLHPASATPRTLSSAFAGLVAAGAAAFGISNVLSGTLTRVVVALAVIVAGGILGGVVGRARWRRTRWKLDERGFYVRRGWLWRTEILIPRSRVQHLDLERGPIERYFGLASVVIHTAGTETAALRQSGLADADAVALRDALIPQANRDGDAL